MAPVNVNGRDARNQIRNMRKFASEVLPGMIAEARKIWLSFFQKRVFTFLALFRGIVERICSVCQVLNAINMVSVRVESVLEEA